MKRITLILALLSFSLLGLQCEQDDDGLFGNSDKNNNDKNQNEEPTLPPATQSGKGTFGCKVNGEVWVPEAPPLTKEIHADYFEGVFTLQANRKLKEYGWQSSIIIYIDSGFMGNKKYNLSSRFSKKYAIYRDIDDNCEYYTDSFHAGKLKVTHFDSSKRIVSGRFHFTAVIKRGECDSDTIRVTEGRFDIKKGY